MSENTTVGPAGANHAPLPVTPHVTYGHQANTPDGGYQDDVAADNMSPVAPTDTDSDFSGAGAQGVNGVQPGNGAPGFSPMSGPVEPLGFNEGNNSTDGTY